ncbi:MAG: ScyD/ScyE family protein [Gemmatimonadales bacterium]|nr:MAG: ScyD/ScyE family protein [Gemmatimonadales bacterium]
MSIAISQSRCALLLVATLPWLACSETSMLVDPPTEQAATAEVKAPTPPGGLVLGAPLFGLDVTPDGSLVAAVSSSGVTSIRGGASALLAELPGVSGVAAVGVGQVYAVTQGSDDPALLLPTSRKLYAVSHGRVREIADLWEYEQAANPDQIWNVSPSPVESNPFNVVALNGGAVLVADAAANDILHVDRNGTVDWVAVLTPVSTPGPQPVATSIAVGPDGDYYAGELTGFPGTPGLSRIWRIAAGSRHVLCPSTACTLVAGGFTSIMDIAFGPDGFLYVVEFDEASWLAVVGGGFAPAAGGTVNRCDVGTGACVVVAAGLSLPTAVTVDKNGTVWIAEHAPVLFAAATVRPLP